MDRFIINDLRDWKNSKRRKPLILRGSRQVGKTWILTEFGKEFNDGVNAIEKVDQVLTKKLTTCDIEKVYHLNRYLHSSTLKRMLLFFNISLLSLMLLPALRL